MDKLEAMFGHLGNLSESELRDRIRHIRKDRRTAKIRKSVKKAARAKSDTAKTKLDKALKEMSPQQLAALLKELENGS